MKPLSLVKCKQDAAYADFLTGAYSDVRDQRKTQVQQCIAQHFTRDRPTLKWVDTSKTRRKSIFVASVLGVREQEKRTFDDELRSISVVCKTVLV